MFLFNMRTWHRGVWSMSIDKTKCCRIHTEEKEKSGECCQLEKQEDAFALTFENEVNAFNNKHKENHE